MVQYSEETGYNFYNTSIGALWIDLIKEIYEEGDTTYDEKRERKSLQNVRVRIKSKDFSANDEIIEKFCDKSNIDSIIYLTFEGEEMYDFDIVPSFRAGSQSYHGRIKEGRMLEYVTKRLTEIPESKKAVISFINWSDYIAVLDTPYDDYLPCILTIHFRICEEKKNYYLMNINFNARSLDVFQKGVGNIIAIRMLGEKVAKTLTKNLSKEVRINLLDGFISDIHIYSENYLATQGVLDKFMEGNKNGNKSN